jgi:HEPN domain-containing protein
MEKQDNIELWLNSSDDNYKSMMNMFKAREYMWSLFIGHLVVEKLLKAYYVKMIGNEVPRTHDLLKLAIKAGIDLDETKKDELQYITLFNIETRYDEYRRDFRAKCSKKFAEENIVKIKGIRKWLKEKLQK